MTSRRFAVVATLCVLSTFAQALSADCLSAIWSTRQSRLDGAGMIRSLQTVDYNRDGKLDLVGLIDPTNLGNQGVLNLWPGLGDGTFAPPVSLGTSDLEHVEVVDINNDGIPDLVMTNRFSQLLVRLGNGTGFDPPMIQNLDYTANQFVSVHLNGDGFADLVMQGFDVIVVYHGDGHGHFTETRRLNATPLVTAVVAADFDGDGLTDIAYAIRPYSGATGSVNVAFQRADGSFEPPLVIPVPDWPSDLAVGDLNEDGLPDLVTLNYNSIYARDPAVVVILNLGSRAFSRSDLTTGISAKVGEMISVRLADVNGDNHLDIVAGAVNGGYVLSYAGKGDGTFRSPTLYASPFSTLYSIALGDFDGDHVPDLAIGNYQSFVTARSSCGTQVYLHTVSPVLTLGQSAPLRALVSGLASSTPLPRGTVTFREGMTTLGSAAIDATGFASLDVSGFPIGSHTLTADFSGNSEALPATSQDIVEKMTNVASTTKFVFPPAPSVDGKPYTFTVDVRNQFGNSYAPGPCFVLSVDGVESNRCSYQVTLTFSAGPHTLIATFLGDTITPPSTSGPVMITTVQPPPSFAYSSGALTVREGENHQLQFSITGPAGKVPSGTARLLNGSTLLGNATVSSATVMLTATLTRGTYAVTAVYSGDTNFAGGTVNLTLTVLPYVPLAIHASSRPNAISIRAVLPDFTTSMTLYRRVSGSGDAWQVINGWTVQSEFDSVLLTRGVLYDYRLDVVADGNMLSSNIDSALLFTDDPVVAGATVVKRVHFDELRLLINALRANAGLAPFSFDSSYAGPLVRASHLASLRTALTEARLALGMSAPSYTDAASSGTRIKAIHVVELRQQAQ
jgi:hypothetical protein